MDPQLERSQALNLARADHVQIALGIFNFRQLFKGARPVDASQQFAEIQHFITQKVTEHFADEERRIFPVVMANKPLPKEIQIITELCAEHEQMLAQAQKLHGQLQRVNLAKCRGELWTALRDFLAALEKHAAKEDRLFESFSAK